jgi:hypothetical protein
VDAGGSFGEIGNLRIHVRAVGNCRILHFPGSSLGKLAYRIPTLCTPHCSCRGQKPLSFRLKLDLNLDFKPCSRCISCLFSHGHFNTLYTLPLNMNDIEEAKRSAHTIEFTESSEAQSGIQMVPVAEDVQTLIRRKVCQFLQLLRRTSADRSL